MKYLISITIVILFSGCMMMLPFLSNKDTQSKMRMMGPMGMINMTLNNKSGSNFDTTKKNTHSKSYIITNKYCTQCHNIKEKTLHSSKEWKITIQRMKRYMQNQGKLEPDEYESVMIEHYYGVDDKN